MISDCLGIDIGNSTSCISVYAKEENKVTVLSVDFNKKTKPTNVVIKKKKKGDNYKYVFGIPNEYGSNSVISDFVRKIGSEEIFEIEIDDEKKTFTPKDIYIKCLESMIKDSHYENAVIIAVPASYKDDKIELIKQMAEQAEFTFIDVVQSPIAVALAYLYQKKIQDKKTVLIFDFGITLNLSLVYVDENAENCKILASEEFPTINSDVIDSLIVDLIKNNFGRQKQNLSDGDIDIIKKNSENVKITLSNERDSSFRATFQGKSFGSHITVKYEQFKNVCEKMFNGIIETVSKFLETTKISKENVNEILLAGGSSNIAEIRNKLKDFFEKELPVLDDVKFEEVVSYGAAAKFALFDQTTQQIDPEQPQYIDPEQPQHIDPEQPQYIDPEQPQHIDPEQPQHIDPEQPRPPNGNKSNIKIYYMVLAIALIIALFIK
ncbi:heat shock 70 kDa protein [Histomonas meleagridis]|uniref:heat shock 70 kDa protein n=1 Tax=Histomonas meleagridis TaxID=135588 RepID=UPI00355A0FC0|nr:heat shock 70 kDa protein [Histomonas meleagridis]KAH0801107.1 heat shock 70 kDa protein [Histomonas meleagridis]